MDEYISATVGGDMFNVGEYWTDLAWNGSELEGCQDAARQVRFEHLWCVNFEFVTGYELHVTAAAPVVDRPGLERLRAGGLPGHCTPGVLLFKL